MLGENEQENEQKNSDENERGYAVMAKFYLKKLPLDWKWPTEFLSCLTLAGTVTSETVSCSRTLAIDSPVGFPHRRTTKQRMH